MTKFTLTLTLAALLAAAAPAFAQEAEGGATVRQPPVRNTLRRDATPSLGSPSPTMETWLYEQERKRYDNPKEIVRRNAEYHMAQRQRRIESRKWFGYSNTRPTASPNPWYETYSPTWTGNSVHPFEWSGVGGPAVVLRPGWTGTGQY
ncbi:MAG: hypothetical protein WD875_17985 [Pirellulales bacterium]